MQSKVQETVMGDVRRHQVDRHDDSREQKHRNVCHLLDELPRSDTGDDPQEVAAEELEAQGQQDERENVGGAQERCRFRGRRKKESQNRPYALR